MIDEIQESSVVYSCIREFARAFTCDFIVTGSYLGKTREKDFFLSAGDTDNLVLGTLTFPEFLEALGKREVYQIFPCMERIRIRNMTRLKNTSMYTAKSEAIQR